MKLEYERSFLKVVKTIKEASLKKRLEVAILELNSVETPLAITAVVRMKGTLMRTGTELVTTDWGFFAWRAKVHSP